jgi:hypothetical protein
MTVIRAKVVQSWQGCAITIHDNSPRFANAFLQPIHSRIARATRIDECRCVRGDGGDMTCQPIPDGAGHAIFAPGCSPMPVVLAPRRIPRPQIRSQAGLAAARRFPSSPRLLRPLCASSQRLHLLASFNSSFCLFITRTWLLMASACAKGCRFCGMSRAADAGFGTPWAAWARQPQGRRDRSRLLATGRTGRPWAEEAGGARFALCHSGVDAATGNPCLKCTKIRLTGSRPARPLPS